MSRLALIAVFFGSAGIASAKPTETLTSGPPTVNGALDVTAVEKVVTAGNSKLLACYKGQFPLRKRAINTTSVTFTIGKAGRVTAASTELSESLDTCLLAAIKKLTFPRPKDGAPVEVTYVLRFERMPGEWDAVIVSGGRPAPIVSPPAIDPVVVRDGSVPTIKLGDHTVKGPLDQGIVNRYVKRQLHGLRFCYETALLATKGLKGTLTITFTIGADGRVSAATATGVSDHDTHWCMEATIKRIKFPKPKGGEVVVTYPVTVDPGEPTKKPAPATTTPTAPAKTPPAKTGPATSATKTAPAAKTAPKPSK